MPGSFRIKGYSKNYKQLVTKRKCNNWNNRLNKFKMKSAKQRKKIVNIDKRNNQPKRSKFLFSTLLSNYVPKSLLKSGRIYRKL